MLAKPGEDGSWVTLATDIIHNQKGQEVFLHIPTPYLHVILIFRKVEGCGQKRREGLPKEDLPREGLF